MSQQAYYLVSDNYITNPASLTTSGASGPYGPHIIYNSGDTIIQVLQRNPASNAAGLPGEFCWGVTGGIPYEYRCYSGNGVTGAWGRIALTTGY
jgi:hypothetical protein